jgi:hypothetical protein
MAAPEIPCICSARRCFKNAENGIGQDRVDRDASLLGVERPKKILDMKRFATQRAKGVGWKHIAADLGVGVGTIYRVALDGSKTREKVF